MTWLMSLPGVGLNTASLALLLHVRQICTWSSPKCAICPVLALCNYGQSRIQHRD